MVLYPSRASVDTWEKMGNEGWGYDSLAPYFRKFATVHAPPQAAKDVVGLTYHNESLIGDGPIQVSFSEGYTKTNSAWMETFAKFGLTNVADVRSGDVSGAFQQPASIDPVSKTRSFAATAYYTPEVRSRPNLTVLTGTTAKKVVFDTTGSEPVASGVLVVSKDGSERTITTSKEVILSAGALMSPQILELSGIGSKPLLEGLKIPVVVENASVGEHLQDHLISCQSFEVNPDVVTSDVLRDPAVLNALVGQYQASREGPMGQSNFSVAYAPLTDSNGVVSSEDRASLFSKYEEQLETLDGQVLKTLFETANEPTAEFLLFPGQVNTVLAEPSSMAEYLAPTRPQNFITVMTLLNHPFSRGSVHVRSSNIHELPVWDPGFNTHPLDLEMAARHAAFVERFVATAPFSELIKPGGATIPEVRARDLETAKEVIRQSAVSDFHPCGSCSMRPKDRGGVVDDKLRVYGVKGLRVVDASIFPIVPLGNIQTSVYAVAEKAADIIRQGL